jgi:Xaa-Pro dipeptidase
MRRACEIVDRAVEAGLARLREGMTEKELNAIICADLTRQGAPTDFCIVLFGERAALPHGVGGGRKLRKGDVVLVDAGCFWQGYVSDITRTVVFGEPTARQRMVWDTVLAANQAAQAAARPGTICEDLDAVARKVITDAGLGEYFVHRLGHGIGLQGHEHPYLDKGSKIALEPGMTFTIEPGVYISGELGVRLENTLLCTPTGAEPLTKMKFSIAP